MKSIMGFTFFLLFLAGIMFATMLEKPRELREMASDDSRLIGITWQPAFMGTDTIPEDSGLFVKFDVDGVISGNGGCNGFRSSIEKSDSGLTVGPLATTRMACPDEIMAREDAFLDALQKVKKIQGNESELHLINDHGAVLLTLTAGLQGEPSN